MKYLIELYLITTDLKSKKEAEEIANAVVNCTLPAKTASKIKRFTYADEVGNKLISKV